jgi:hypothetical protein
MDFASVPVGGGDVTVSMAKVAPENPPPAGQWFLNVNWDISTGMGGFTAQVVFHYDEGDLPSGIGESDLAGAYRWDGSFWDGPLGTLDTDANTVTVLGVIAFSDWALGGNNPTAVDLVRFEAISDKDAIRVEWETTMEIDNVGFNLYRRGAQDGPYVKLNDLLIPAQNPGQTWGSAYAWLDEDVVPGATYYYKLEDVEVEGISTFHGPVSTTALDAPTASMLTAFATRGGDSVVWTVGGLGALVIGVLVWRRRHGQSR